MNITVHDEPSSLSSLSDPDLLSSLPLPLSELLAESDSEGEQTPSPPRCARRGLGQLQANQQLLVAPSLGIQQVYFVHLQLSVDFLQVGFVRLQLCVDLLQVGFVCLQLGGDLLQVGFVHLQLRVDLLQVCFFRLQLCVDLQQVGFVHLQLPVDLLQVGFVCLQLGGDLLQAGFVHLQLSGDLLQAGFLRLQLRVDFLQDLVFPLQNFFLLFELFYFSLKTDQSLGNHPNFRFRGKMEIKLSHSHHHLGRAGNDKEKQWVQWSHSCVAALQQRLGVPQQQPVIWIHHAPLKCGNGEQSKILLLLSITHQIDVDQLLHLWEGAVDLETTTTTAATFLQCSRFILVSTTSSSATTSSSSTCTTGSKVAQLIWLQGAVPGLLSTVRLSLCASSEAADISLSVNGCSAERGVDFYLP
ncbi:hypothetical protein INR49_004805 [Caranx melampygus]|nr:hypothetical protein INR49_004805 [Caranx melampygus]